MNHLASFLHSFVDFTATGIIRPIPAHEPSEQFVFHNPKRLVAIGDLHGDILAAERAFTAAGLIDDKGKWCGGSTVCVQVSRRSNSGNQCGCL